MRAGAEVCRALLEVIGGAEGSPGLTDGFMTPDCAWWVYQFITLNSLFERVLL